MIVVAGRHEGDGPPDGVESDAGVSEGGLLDVEGGPAQKREGTPRRERKHRRVSTELVPGSDPNPQPEPRRHSGEENDDRLKAERPPHWG